MAFQHCSLVPVLVDRLVTSTVAVMGNIRTAAVPVHGMSKLKVELCSCLHDTVVRPVQKIVVYYGEQPPPDIGSVLAPAASGCNPGAAASTRSGLEVVQK